MLRRYCPPTSNSASVIWPSEQQRTASISTSKTLSLAITACCRRLSIAGDSPGQAQDFNTLNKILIQYVHPLYALRDHVKGYEVTVVKEMMELLGIPAGPARPPLCPVKPEHKAELHRIVELYRNPSL